MKNSFSNSGPGNGTAAGPSKLTVCGTYVGGPNANRQDPTNILYAA